MTHRSTYHSKIYREFRSIDTAEWRTIIRFYEMYEDKIERLNFDEYFEMLLAYANALFVVGEYEKHLVVADRILEASVMNNVKFFKGEDIFQKTLFKKAASNFNLHRLEKCDYLLRELLRIDPHDRLGALFLKKCLRSMRSSLIRITRATAVLLLLLSAVVISAELFVVQPVYPQYAPLIAIARTLTLGLSFFILLGGELYHRLRCKHEVDNFVAHLRKRKKREKAGR